MATGFTVPTNKEDVLRAYNFAVIHLRQQYRFNRIGLTIGAGASVPLNYPSWDGLIQRIAGDPIFPRNLLHDLPEASLSSTTQRLFEYFSKCVPPEAGETERLYGERVANKWKRILSECLYRENKGEDKEKNIANHPYLSSLINVIENSNVVVNFNFDDSIEHALEIRNSKRRKPEGQNIRNQGGI